MSRCSDADVLVILRACHTADPCAREMWRVPEVAMPVPVCASVYKTPHDNDSRRVQFCLHGFTSSTVAGTVCNECGVVVSQIHTSVDASYCRPPVCKSAPSTEPSRMDGNGSPTDLAVCFQEWKRHTADISNQPNEVMHSAYHTFQLVHQQQGPVSGCKARAVILVSLLYSNRLLYGNNTPNEKYLIQRFNIPTRAMNRAFGSLAAVTLMMTVDVHSGDQ